ncbi:transmembrane protein 45A-like [Triticum aestivum]|uniref:transmembrane protein 45A-like n=1 Tax=Triticum aestivum TaxID=4565 RepID=UPI001D00E14E|nr:transmembrane protein 45A-like [Triticum aestivum]
MGDFVGHALPGSLLLLVGLWRVWASIARFATDPTAFRVRVCSSSAGPRLLELYVVTGGAFLDMCMELFYSNPLRVLTGRGFDPTHLNGLEHASMLLMFFLFGALALLSHKTRYLPLSDAALSLVFACAFTSEFLLFYFHSTTQVGLEAYYHRLLLLIGLCIAAIVLGALLPASFPADLGTGVLITVQGLWFFQTGFTLYGPTLPAGCAHSFDAPGADAHVECRDGPAQERAEHLAIFQLFGLVFLAFVYVLGCYAVAAARFGHQDLTTTKDMHIDVGGIDGESKYYMPEMNGLFKRISASERYLV